MLNLRNGCRSSHAKDRITWLAGSQRNRSWASGSHGNALARSTTQGSTSRTTSKGASQGDKLDPFKLLDELSSRSFNPTPQHYTRQNGPNTNPRAAARGDSYSQRRRYDDQPRRNDSSYRERQNETYPRAPSRNTESYRPGGFGNRDKKPNEPYPSAHSNATQYTDYSRQNPPYPRHNPTDRNERQNPPYPRNNNFFPVKRQNMPYPRVRHPEIPHTKKYPHSFHPQPVKAPPVISPSGVIPFFEGKVSEWSSLPHTHARLVSYGLPAHDANKLLRAFRKDVESGALSDPESQDYYNIERFSHPHDSTSIDAIYSTIFFQWASNRDHQERLGNEVGVQPITLWTIERLTKATSRLFPADEFPNTRAMHRKVIMHVGPTNSGKTHHALRALAAARTGVYAGPLRLLAHEIWQRLNSGQIVPLGMEGEVPSNRKGDPKYARLCNMITGEEQKLMDGDVGHLSCTVEMLSMTSAYDVAVIDEIQMIGDPDRGPGWVNAVIGTRAKEVHLCGEETAVPVVQALLEHTGDEVEVRRYERLTPLVVEEESLKGDFTKIRKGDCIVAFSRSAIYGMKKSVEDATGLRCAVVYGRLPPEVRSEQAALFNNPDSGYDVIIGSDAIGMGLNLKIKRVIFAATSKYNGHDTLPLEVSSVKQIAGRAGRYGQHAEQADLGGTVTTLYDEDLPHLKHCVATPYKPLPSARIGYEPQLIENLLSILPTGTDMHTAISAPRYIGRLPPFMRYAGDSGLTVVCSYIDKYWRNMRITDKMALLYSPVPWRDEKFVETLKGLLDQQSTGNPVDFLKSLQGTGLIELLEASESQMRMDEAGLPLRSREKSATLMQMEALHKFVVFYLWMSFRNPLLYSEREMVAAYKEKLERVLNWTLDKMSQRLVQTHGLQAMLRGQPVQVNKDPIPAALTEVITPTDPESLPVL